LCQVALLQSRKQPAPTFPCRDDPQGPLLKLHLLKLSLQSLLEKNYLFDRKQGAPPSAVLELEPQRQEPMRIKANALKTRLKRKI
jgi:hypothetical protein